jgi:hypothetical protein
VRAPMPGLVWAAGMHGDGWSRAVGDLACLTSQGDVVCSAALGCVSLGFRQVPAVTVRKGRHGWKFHPACFVPLGTACSLFFFIVIVDFLNYI